MEKLVLCERSLWENLDKTFNRKLILIQQKKDGNGKIWFDNENVAIGDKLLEYKWAAKTLQKSIHFKTNKSVLF